MRISFNILLGLIIATCLGLHNVAAQDSLQERLAAAEQTYRQEGPEAALAAFQQLSSEAESSGGSLEQGIAVHFIGEINWRLGNYEEAAKQLQRALELKQIAGDRLLQARTLNVMGLLNWDLGDYDKAKSSFKAAMEIAESFGDKRLQGAILNNLSLVLDEMGDYLVSIEQYRQVLKLYEGLDFPRGTGDTLGNIGGVYLLLGRYGEALDYYRQALEISEQLGSAASLSQDHGNIGLCYLGLGQADIALDHFARAIAISVDAGMAQDHAYWLRQAGNAWIRKGRYDKGLDSHRKALALYEEIDGKTELVEAFNDMGQMQRLLGDMDSSASYFQQSLAVSREIGLARGITMNQLALGRLKSRQGAYDEALALYQKAVQRAMESAEMTNWSQGLLLMADAYVEQLRFTEADKASRQALEIASEIGATGIEAEANYQLANSGLVQKDDEGALSHFNRSLQLIASSPNSDLQWRVLHGRGLVLARLGDTGEAIDSLKSAIVLIEGVRDQLREERFRAGYLQDKYQVYVDLVRLQLQTGQQEDAFTTAERLRSRSFLDIVEAGALPANSSADQLAEYALKERILQLRKALSAEAIIPRADQRQTAIRVYSQELLAAETEYQAMLDDHRSRDVGDRTGRRVPTYEDIRSRLSADEALIEYLVGDTEIMLFVLTSDRLFSHTVPIRQVDLTNKVELVRNLIRRHDNDRWKKPASSLARTLIDPVRASGYLSGVNHLFLVPHGILNYLPFALLPDVESADSGLVIEEFTLTYLPTAAALLREGSALPKTASMLAMAPYRGQLQNAREEARAVSALFHPDSHLLVGESATESAFKSIAANYRNLHLATHAYFNRLNPLLSGLDLEADADNDGQLELHEILGMRLDADLVTLSACQTGLGSGHFTQIPAGDDFVGLTRAFLYAGSDAVLATLWEVDDSSTMSLMTAFYNDFKTVPSPGNKAEALAHAQRRMLSSQLYRHPYFWAPFVLVGEMRQDRQEKT